MLLAFVPGAASWAFIVLIQPAGLGSHATIYTEAAAAWIRGADPWSVGPPAAVFAGPPTMLLPFVPFIPLPGDATRIAWFAGDLVLAALVLRTLRLPAFWIAFPPLFSAIILGHAEVLVLALIVAGRTLSGLAVVIKPYAVFPLVAERRWGAIAVAVLVAAATLPFLPWSLFLGEAGKIGATLSRQSTGDSTFGDLLLMAAAIVSLLALGPKRALWLGVPVLWPYAQAIYKVMTVPRLPPVVAIFWALPVPGATLAGLVALASLIQIERRRPLPAWLHAGVEPAAQFSAHVVPPTERTSLQAAAA